MIFLMATGVLESWSFAELECISKAAGFGRGFYSSAAKEGDTGRGNTHQTRPKAPIPTG